jgi:hypothetical protein
MTREKALQVTNLLCKIETYEALIDEITGLQTLDELAQAYGEPIEEELIAVVQLRLDKLLKELEELQ